MSPARSRDHSLEHLPPLQTDGEHGCPRGRRHGGPMSRSLTPIDGGLPEQLRIDAGLIVDQEDGGPRMQLALPSARSARLLRDSASRSSGRIRHARWTSVRRGDGRKQARQVVPAGSPPAGRMGRCSSTPVHQAPCRGSTAVHGRRHVHTAEPFDTRPCLRRAGQALGAHRASHGRTRA